MTDWYGGLSGIEQFLLVVALFSTLIFAIQFAITLFGLGGDDADLDPGDEGVGFGDIFTVRNGVSFLMGFSWGGLMAYDWGLTHPLLVAIIGFMTGTTLVALPSMHELAKMAGMELPDFLGRLMEEGNLPEGPAKPPGGVTGARSAPSDPATA